MLFVTFNLPSRLSRGSNRRDAEWLQVSLTVRHILLQLLSVSPYFCLFVASGLILPGIEGVFPFPDALDGDCRRPEADTDLRE